MDRWRFVRRDYFASRPSHLIAFENDWGGMNYAEQEELLDTTLRHDQSKIHPPSLQYRISFLKYIIKKLEDAGAEVCDALYEDFGDLLGMSSLEEGDMCYKTYILPQGAMLSLKESKQLISQGTTGLRTWQAAQYLAEWAMENPEIFEGKRIVELGSGLGFTGLVVCKRCLPRSYTFTDCHHWVMKYLAENIEENHSALIPPSDKCEKTMHCGETEDNISKCRDGDYGNGWKPNVNFWKQMALADSCCTRWQHKMLPNIDLCMFDWETFSLEDTDSLLGEIDVIVAADVVYDSSIIPSLVKVVQTLLKQPHGPVAYVASTIRNEATRDEFFTHLDNAGIQHLDVPGPKEEVFIYDRSVPIQIVKLDISEK